MLSIPFNKLPFVPDKKPTVFVREHSLKLQQSWSRISAGNKCIWACNLYSILIVFCLFFLCLIVYYTTYQCLLHTYLLLMYLTKNIIKVMNLFEQSLLALNLFDHFTFGLTFMTWISLLDFLPTSTQWNCIGNINSAQNWIKRWVHIFPCSCYPHYLLVRTIPCTWKAKLFITSNNKFWNLIIPTF